MRNWHGPGHSADLGLCQLCCFQLGVRRSLVSPQIQGAQWLSQHQQPTYSTCCLMSPKLKAVSLSGLPPASQNSSGTCCFVTVACLLKLGKLRKIRDGLPMYLFLKHS